MALEASADLGPFGFKRGPPGGEDIWAEKMREHREHRDKGKQVANTGDFDTSL